VKLNSKQMHSFHDMFCKYNVTDGRECTCL